MHYSRILSLIGVVVAGIGFLLVSATSDGEAALPDLSKLNELFPVGFDNTWTALYNDTAWAAVLYAIIAVVALVLAFVPPMSKPMARPYALGASVLGVVMLVIGIVATMGAMDDADTLQDGFAQAASLGAIPEAFTVSIGYGWYMLIGAGVLVAAGGIISAVAKPSAGATSAA